MKQAEMKQAIHQAEERETKWRLAYTWDHYQPEGMVIKKDHFTFISSGESFRYDLTLYIGNASTLVVIRQKNTFEVFWAGELASLADGGNVFAYANERVQVAEYRHFNPQAETVNT